MIPRAFIGFAFATLCACAAFEVPTAPDATLAANGASCRSVWDCELGLGCTRGVCGPLPAPPDAPADAAEEDAAIADAPVDASSVDDLGRAVVNGLAVGAE